MDKERNRVGVVTLYSDNFGSCLQAYALCCRIHSLGYCPIIVKYIPFSRGGGGNKQYSKLQKIIHLPIKSTLHILSNYRMIRGKKEAFQHFRETQFQFTDKTYSKYEDKSDLDGQFEVFVCGSDMMWCETFLQDWEQYFLRFTTTEKRVAYAPSFGINRISDANLSRCKDFLSGFLPSRLSCRDISGVQMIYEKFGFTAHHVLDPTMLFNKDEWGELVEAERVIDKKYVLLYLFGGQSGSRRQILEQVKGWHMGELKSLSISGDYCIRDPHIGPFEYVRLFRDAEFVITDTFHGMIFSLIFEKPFVVLSRNDGQHWAKYSDRMTAQLDLLKISERYHNPDQLMPDSFKALDYSEISPMIESLREQSIDYLHNAIKSVLNNQ